MPTTRSQDTHGTPAATLQIIRASIAAAPLMFALVSTQVRKVPAEPPVVIGYAAAGVALFALGLMCFFQSRSRTLPTRGERATYAVIGWALGESAAFFGGVSYFVGNHPLWTIPGFVVLALALILFPVPQDEPAR